MSYQTARRRLWSVIASVLASMLVDTAGWMTISATPATIVNHRRAS